MVKPDMFTGFREQLMLSIHCESFALGGATPLSLAFLNNQTMNDKTINSNEYSSADHKHPSILLVGLFFVDNWYNIVVSVSIGRITLHTSSSRS